MEQVLTRKQAKALKRSLLGFCGRDSSKSGGDIASALVKIGIVEDMKSAREFIPKIIDKYLHYSSFSGLRIGESSFGRSKGDLFFKSYHVWSYIYDGDCNCSN